MSHPASRISISHRDRMRINITQAPPQYHSQLVVGALQLEDGVGHGGPAPLAPLGGGPLLPHLGHLPSHTHTGLIITLIIHRHYIGRSIAHRGLLHVLDLRPHKLIMQILNFVLGEALPTQSQLVLWCQPSLMGTVSVCGIGQYADQMWDTHRMCGMRLQHTPMPGGTARPQPALASW